MSVYYHIVNTEVETVNLASQLGLPVLLKGPTGCGKTRFVRYMAEKLGRELITVLCQEDLTASDLTGRYLIKGGDTVWQDGPLTTGVRNGSIVYLDEVVEARTDVLSTIHSLTDDRRELTLERTGETLKAPEEFMLIVSYNPSPHSLKKRLSSATQQRFVSLFFDYPNKEIEKQIIANETNIELSVANRLVKFGVATRRLQQAGLHQGASTRCLVNAAKLIKAGMPQSEALRTTLVNSLTDDKSLREALNSIIEDEN